MGTALRELEQRTARRLLLANTAALVLAYALPRGIAFLATVVAARVLGAAAFGGYATAAALAVVASIFGTLGMQPLLVRDIARDPRRAAALLAAADAVKAAALALLALALLAGILLLRPPAPVAIGATLLGAAYAVGAFVDNRGAYFQGVERMHVWTRASALAGIVTGALGVLLAVGTRSLVAFCAAPLAGQTAALFWLRARVPARTIRPGDTPVRVGRLLRALAPFAAAFVATTVYYRADVLLLAHWRPAYQVGLYGAARRFLDVAQALALAAAGALLPRLARSRGDAPTAARSVLLLASAAAAATLFASRRSVLALVYGPAFAGAEPVLALLAPAIVPLTLNMLALSVFAARDRMGTAARCFLLAAILLLGLDSWLIPARGAVGAAAAELVSECVLALLLAHGLARPRRP